MHTIRKGSGKPLLLVHGPGCSARSWDPVLAALSAQREVIAVDLPGFGEAPALAGPVTVATLTDAVEKFVSRAALADLVHGVRQQGAPAGSLQGTVVIGWGRQDLVTVPSEAGRVTRLFPDATLHWFDQCGHFPHWDQPDQAGALILAATS